MTVTIKDIAKLTNVSPATVSRVINDDPRICQETKLRVLECIKEQNYRVNKIARSLRKSKTNTIGFMCPELSNTFFMNIAKGIESELIKQNYNMVVCNSNEDIKFENIYIDLLCENCVDGVIIIPASGQGRHYSVLKNNNIPVVLVDRLVNDFETDAVLVDNINGSYRAIEQLIDRGNRRIGFIGGNIELTSASERYEGYKRVLNDYHIPYDTNIVKFGDYHTESGYAAISELMALPTPPDSVFISNYYMYLGTAKYFLEAENQHKRITLASFDNMEFSSLFGLNGLIIEQPMTDMGCKAAQMLINRIDTDKGLPPQISRLKTNIISIG